MRYFTTVHLLLLSYIIAALFFWGVSLTKQSHDIYEKEKIILHQQEDSSLHPLSYAVHMQEIEGKRMARSKQYIGEGITFLIVILIGAVVVYSSFRRSIRLSTQQNNFMLSVTHELKSPIAAMKLNLQTLEKHQLDEEKKKMLLDRCILESNRLNELCNKMLFASQMEGKQYQPARERIDFSKFTEQVLKDYISRYPKRFADDLQADCMLLGDKLLLQVAINNLIENAIKYTPAEKIIKVVLKGNEKNVILQVIDEGQGIADDEKKKIFNKFYRIGSENTRTSKGTGLGLYLTAKIVHHNKGKIVVKDNVPQGSIFEISLPAA
ncbi:MAG: ATP-binding protein [Bacteroidota bacterium]